MLSMTNWLPKGGEFEPHPDTVLLWPREQCITRVAPVDSHGNPALDSMSLGGHRLSSTSHQGTVNK